jgi:hypothetical protein
MGELILIILAFCLYFLPCIVGWNKKHNAWAIFLLNLLFGWTVVGWIVALIWAATDDPKQVIKFEKKEDGVDKLYKLKKLRDSNIITEDDFERKKNEILNDEGL